MATFAALLKFDLPDNAAEDSHNLLPLISGKASESPRTTHVHNTFKNRYAIRHGDWLLIDGPNGYHSRGFENWEKKNEYTADDQNQYELYNLADDLAQKKNLATIQPQVVNKLVETLGAIRTGTATSPRLQK